MRGKAYVYPRYRFSNRSEDIRQIFARACETLGVSWKRMNEVNLSVNRREDVALLDLHIGRKR